MFSSTASADAEFAALLEEFDAGTFELSGVEVTRENALFMIASSLYEDDAFTYLRYDLAWLDDLASRPESTRQTLRLMAEGAGMVDAQTDEFVGAPVSTGAAYYAVNCADRADPADIESYREGAEQAAETSPFFGPEIVWDAAVCAYWPVEDRAPTDVAAENAPPIVVVGTEGDPATPYAWAEEVTAQLETSVLLTYEGNGHTVYGQGRSSCIDDPVDDYLISGNVPENGLSCPAVTGS